MNIFEKIQTARLKVRNKNLKKSGNNKFAGFSYYELKDFMPTIQDIMSELKMFAKFSINNNLASLVFIDTEKPEDQIEFTAPAERSDIKGASVAQGWGATITYMTKYLYITAFELIENDILDANSGNGTLSNSRFSQISTAEELNLELKKLKFTDKKQDKFLLNDRARQLGYHYDINAGAFVK